jgi:hypothetical protein
MGEYQVFMWLLNGQGDKDREQHVRRSSVNNISKAGSYLTESTTYLNYKDHMKHLGR